MSHIVRDSVTPAILFVFGVYFLANAANVAVAIPKDPIRGLPLGLVLLVLTAGTFLAARWTVMQNPPEKRRSMILQASLYILGMVAILAFFSL